MNHRDLDLARLRTETERLCRRYIDEIVLPYSLCPWAAPALTEGKVQIRVITDVIGGVEEANEAAIRVLEELACAPANIELCLIVLPRCRLTRLEMDDLLRAVRHLQRPVGVSDPSEEVPLQGEVGFALAAFHPDAAPDTTSPERLIPFLRRTPDPTIQAVRTASLAKINADRGAGTAYFDLKSFDLSRLDAPAPKPLRLRVAEANYKTCEGVIDELEGRYAEIQGDHRQTREDLGG